MLALSRKLGETLNTGPDIEITLLEINGNQACIGITALRDVAVFRSELVGALSEWTYHKTTKTSIALT